MNTFDTKEIENLRCGVLQVKSYSKEIQSFYNDIQEDYKKFIKLFYNWISIGRTEFVGDIPVVIEPEQARKERLLDHPLVDKFLAIVLKGGIGASSCYNLFYKDYESNGPTYSVFRKKILSKLIHVEANERRKLIKNDPIFNAMDDETLDSLSKKLVNQSEEVIKTEWNNIASQAATSDRAIGAELSNLFDIKCKRPNDKNYCTILMEMVGRQIRSINKKYKMHVDDYEALKAEVESFQSDLFKDMVNFSEDLYKDKKYGFSKYVLKQAIRANCPIQIIADNIKNYPNLINADYKDLMIAYGQWKKLLKLKNRRKYPVVPRMDADYKVPIGLTSLGFFKFSDNNGNLVAEIMKLGQLECLRSHYFADFKFEPITNKNRLSGYNIEFCHLTKTPKKHLQEKSRIIKGVVKEIGLLCKNGKFYLTLPYTINFPQNVEVMTNFFAYAEKKDLNEMLFAKKLELVDKVRVAGTDLNISNPIVTTIGEIYKNVENGKLDALDFGSGDVIKSPAFVVGNGSYNSKLYNITKLCNKLKIAIREYKASINKNIEISQKSIELLKKCKLSDKTIKYLESGKRVRFGKNKGNKPDPIRYYINSWMQTINKKLKKYHFECRKTGYSSIADMIRILQAKDAYWSLVKTYNSIHLQADQNLPFTKIFNKNRENFRLFTSRRLAHAVAEYLADNNVDVAFFEDLNSNYDFDNDNNALQRLFNASTLLKIIKQALHKRGIGMVLVDKKGTSKTDPVTGLLGFRPKYSKCDLVVERDNKLVRIDADKAASLNVMIRGLNHSITPYSLFALDFNAKSKQEKTYGKRASRFFGDKYQNTKVGFVPNVDGKCLVVSFREITKAKSEYKKNCRVYYRSAIKTFITEELHKKEEKEFKDRCSSWHKLPIVDVTPMTISKYANFSAG